MYDTHLTDEQLQDTPFTDRQVELCFMATECMKVISTQGVPLGSMNNIKLPIISTSQMWGSGKTSIGQHFIHAMKSRPDLCGIVLAHFDKNPNQWPQPHSMKPAEALKRLTSLVSITLDLRAITVQSNSSKDIAQTWSLAVADALFRVYHRLVGNTTRPLPSDQASIIINSLERANDFFFHFDEIDNLIANSHSDEDSICILYKFWEHVLQPLVIMGAPVYISGRSSVLLLLNQHLFPDFISPTRTYVTQILLH
ncbi:hypothetical protein SAMD00019534_064890 [Acytostelium subglobosum LB1]|uniref:hypothetical protein n=1 Tax=Acytostelium subglobosum LB1 TaxID=1410327 RepID=UPI000644B79C|nr:hypothetical protein SAMD00019534_064890 [Acytostelium subglobosum LB1]GAM23314.1 hypothetical protein SAMD00019534_064890 [Acytostelium subglobosum LB1]|eukprot:XP_012753763.1 hypothetical protein SAMD00019534_064890 [Acytostelium subglobosum LB1]